MKRFFIFIVLILTNVISVIADDECRLMRFPSVYGDQIVFTYAGDLYLVSTEGGLARKITSGNGFEMFARFSPDGKNIAFTGQYDGNTEVYLIPSKGGFPKRITYTAMLKRDDISDRMGPNNIVMSWSPDGKSIIFRSRMWSFNDFIGQLFSVKIEGGIPSPLPLSTGGFCSYSPDGTKLAFNRVFREFRTWKYYKGGMADDIRIFDFSTKKTINITNTSAQEVFPMWIDSEIYFLSDRDRIMNLYCYDTKSGETKKVTDFKEYDIKFPSFDQNSIVFENGGYIFLYSVKEKTCHKITINISNDLPEGRNCIVDASNFIQSVDVAPGGERLCIAARGDVFSIPVHSGVVRNLTRSSNANDRSASWSPNGKYIAWISDQSGENELWIGRQDGSEAPRQISKNADTYYFNFKWSPDSKKLLWHDKKLRLRYIDIESRREVLVAESGVWEFGDYSWSPDSKWITYVQPRKTGMNTIHLFELSSGKSWPVTDEWYESYNPAFSPDGKYLLFVSDRDFNPIYSATEWNHAYSDMSKVYLATLSSTVADPLSIKNDEVDENPNSNDSTLVTIEPNGIANRIISLPIESSNYWSVSINKNRIYYLKRSLGDENTSLMMFDLEEREEVKITDCNWYRLAAGGKKILIVKDGKYYVSDVPKIEWKASDPVSLNNMYVMVDRQAEWKQIYYEAWRQMRDFFYMDNMHGLDWNKMRQKYEVLLPYVYNRHDLNYIIGELIGELNVGHAYIGGGDTPDIPRITTGLLGATFVKDPSGFFRITRILEGANWSDQLRSPLTAIGLNMQVGDFIVAVDGISTADYQDMYMLMLNKANKPVELTVNKVGSMQGARKIIVTPLSDESALYYFNWVQHNIKVVSDATNGQVGYIHIPDMGVEGLNEFVKYFYPQLNKKALIIDDRGNGGGNVSPMLIERLLRIPTRSNMARNVTEQGQTPTKMMLGPKVLLINQYSASDGDLFPYAFKKHGIGKVIGVRTWGGVVGIRGSLPFVDGTSLNRPEFASYSIDRSEWIIEGIGVEPDIEVDNDPYEEYMGNDAQLQKAIEVILEELKNYQPIPDIPVGPDKSH